MFMQINTPVRTMRLEKKTRDKFLSLPVDCSEVQISIDFHCIPCVQKLACKAVASWLMYYLVFAFLPSLSQLPFPLTLATLGLYLPIKPSHVRVFSSVLWLR